MNDDWHPLFNAALNGALTPEENTRLAALLKSDPEARQLWYLYHDIEAGLGELPPVASKSRQRAFTWSPLSAAAAGLAIGLFSASMVWGYVGNWANRAVMLWAESFESGPPPSAYGMPSEPGLWSGDFTELSGESGGVKPALGQRMLRFRRADYEGKPARDGYVADLFRIIDLKGVDRNSSLIVEAKFAAQSQGGLTIMNCGVTMLALDALPPRGMRDDSLLRRLNAGLLETGEPESEPHILAMATRSEDAEVSIWRTVRSELSLPAEARYVLLHLRTRLVGSHRPEFPKPVEYTGLFLDDIRITLAHRDS